MNEIGYWIESLPPSWEIKPLKAVATYSVSNVDKVPADGESPVRLCNYTDVYKNEFINLTLDFMHSTATHEEIKKFGLKMNDVVITKDSESWDDIAIPALVSETAEDLVCGYHLAVLRPMSGQILGRFLFRCLQAKPIRLQLELASTGVTRFGLPKQEIGKLVLPIPSLSEQRAIAKYLDRETAQLDALVTAKERLLELLAEKRRALIAHAVTHGLNADAPLRDSGIDWLGEIPAHWQTPPVYARFEVQLGKMLDEKRIKGTHLAPYLRNVDVQWGRINTSDLPAMDFDEDDKEKYDLKSGDILVCEGGEIGRCALWRGEIAECYYQKALHRLRPIHNADDPAFFVQVMRTLVDAGVFSLQATTSTIQHLPPEKLLVLRYPSPPIEEQRAIVAHIATETAKLDALRAATKRTIALLKERRAALIAAAVTGRIDVRELSYSDEDAAETPKTLEMVK
ncbi:MAG: restriction endonuclease subunit S [Acidobacteria bacterium]|nr:restriction endonuclease subunit S [Acidobacteriota bacterium]